MVYNLLINGVYWSYNPVTNHLLSSWDIQVTITFPNPLRMARWWQLQRWLARDSSTSQPSSCRFWGWRGVAYKMPCKWHAMLANLIKPMCVMHGIMSDMFYLYYLFINRMQTEHTWMLYCFGKSWPFALLTYILSALKKPSFGFGFSGLLFLWYLKGIIVWTTAKVEEVQFLRQFFGKGHLSGWKNNNIINPSLFMVEIIFKRKGGLVDQKSCWWCLMIIESLNHLCKVVVKGCSVLPQISFPPSPTCCAYNYCRSVCTQHPGKKNRLEAAGTSGERSTNRSGQCTYAGHALRQGIVDHGYLARSSHPPFSILVYIPWWWNGGTLWGDGFWKGFIVREVSHYIFSSGV